MKYLFDSSAIFKAIKENKIEVLVGNFTLELARYELGNVLWKSFVLEGKATSAEIKSLAKIVKQTLGVMNVLQIGCSEEEILEVAGKAKITFYDAAYVYHAMAKNLTLVTEDSQLLKKVTPKISASTLSGITV
ncbi:MAG: type II toxin-antitoxin system VapC family toxin [Candidatus Bathyarchaeota archaeon]|jgi:predicted nucleic acid-binding protein|nr:type II toxin-antitoxin system VapC family toxin [Candidatus Bathyarchaeota archaeon A05DMB-3]MDH7606741.1 type II toxin-antitoxin system VapC family toxin [Candidatus Bathyarchaeota archaeon]